MSVFRRFASLFRKQNLNAEMSEELRHHVELRAQKNRGQGMSVDDARYAAQRSFGGAEQIKERCRDERGGRWLEYLKQDLRYGGRMLRKNPGFTTVAVLTLAFGIGANTALFTIVNGLMLRPLPVADPGRLVLLQSKGGDESFSYATYERFRTEVRGMEGLALSRRGTNRLEFTATGLGATESESVRAQMVTGNYFAVLGAQAAIGRVFTADEDRMDQPQGAVVLSHAYWQRRFGGDPAVIGRSVQLEKMPFTIVGVMPRDFPGFELGVNPDLWWPLPMFPQVESDPQSLGRLRDEGWEWALILGRLAKGVSREQAQRELQTMFYRQRVAFAAERAKWSDQQRREYLERSIELISGASGYTSLRRNLARPVAVLGVIVGLVLLIACANLAGLLLARGATRARELAVRAALGAGRGRLVRQLLTESLLLALIGGVGGMLLALWGTTILGGYLPQRGETINLAPDGRVLGFAFALSVLTGVLFGLVPAWRLGENALMTTSKSGASTRSWLNQALVIAQIALSVTLLAGAGLFVRSLQKLKSVELGFQPENLVGFSLDFSRTYNGRQRADVHKRVLETISALPDVRSATLSGAGLFSGDGFGIRVEPQGYTPQQDEVVRALVVVAGPRFFSTLGIPLRAGREFTLADEVVEGGPRPPGAVKNATIAETAPGGRHPPQALPPNTPRIAIVGESFARRYFGTADVVGRTVKFGLNNQNPPLEIVGVAADIKYRTVREKPEMEMYVPYFGGALNMPMVVRVATRSDPRAFAANVRAIVRQIDPRVGVGELQTMQRTIDDSLVQERVVAQLGGFFSIFALVLASFGLYGVLAYGVVQRTREIGVRMALGASVRDVVALIVQRGVALAIIGGTIGMLAAIGLTRFVAKLLYGVEPTDPLTFAGAVGVLLIVALIACWLPARRAAKVDPMVALRVE
jgi:predicted permease